MRARVAEPDAGDLADGGTDTEDAQRDRHERRVEPATPVSIGEAKANTDSVPPATATQVASTSHSRSERTPETSCRSDSLGRSWRSRGTVVTTTAAATTARAASAQNAVRQPNIWPANDPRGTPTTLAIIPPPCTIAIAPARRAGPARSAATRPPTVQNPLVATEATHLAAISTQKSSVSTDTSMPPENTTNDDASVTLRWTRAVSSAINGAPPIIPNANTVTVNPARASEIPKSAARSGSSPAMMNSLVDIRNVQHAMMYTAAGTRSAAR